MTDSTKLINILRHIDNNRLKQIAKQTIQTFTYMVKSEENIDFYAVFRKQGEIDNPNQLYDYIGKTKVKSFIDFDVQNGIQYWYAIVSVDKAGNMSCPGFPIAGESKALVALTEDSIPYEVSEDVFIVNGKIYRTGNKIPIIPGYTIEIPNNAFVEIKHDRITVPEASDITQRTYDSATQTHTFKETKGAFIWGEKSISDPSEVKSHLPVVVKANVRFASKGYRPQLYYRKKGEENWQVAPMQRGAFDKYQVDAVSEAGKAQINNIKIEKLNSHIGGELLVKPVSWKIDGNLEFVFQLLKPTDKRYVEQLQVFAHLMYDIMHEVKEGDTWSIISQQYSVREFDLKKYNKNIILENGKFIKVPSGLKNDEYFKVEMSCDAKSSKESGKEIFVADKSKWKEIDDKSSDNQLKIRAVVTVNFGGIKNQFTSDMYSVIKGG